MKYLLIFIYVAVSILLFVLNWDVFSAPLIVDLGFGEFKTLPFLVLQIFGGVVLGIFALIDGIKDLKSEVKIGELKQKILLMQKDAEIANLKMRNDVKMTENELIKELQGSTQKMKVDK
jgi:hypothetical protein